MTVSNGAVKRPHNLRCDQPAASRTDSWFIHRSPRITTAPAHCNGCAHPLPLPTFSFTNKNKLNHHNLTIRFSSCLTLSCRARSNRCAKSSTSKQANAVTRSVPSSGRCVLASPFLHSLKRNHNDFSELFFIPQTNNLFFWGVVEVVVINIGASLQVPYVCLLPCTRLFNSGSVGLRCFLTPRVHVVELIDGYKENTWHR